MACKTNRLKKRRIKALGGPVGDPPKKPDYTGMGIGFMNQTPEERSAVEREMAGRTIPMDPSTPKYIGGYPPLAGIVGRVGQVAKAYRGLNYFKPNPRMLYRGLGEAGAKDALATKVFRGAKNARTGNVPAETYFAPHTEMKMVKEYGSKYIAQVPKSAAKFERTYPTKDWSQFTLDQIPINKGSILKKDWMSGYKAIPLKETGGNIMAKRQIIRKNVVVNPEFNPDEYSFGGWLKENIGGIAKTAAGIGAMFIPGAQGVGTGLIAGGVGDMLGGSGEEEISEVYRPAVSKSKQIYDTTVAEGGMNLKRLSRRTDYKGETHANGGINLDMSGNNVQVEDGESRTGDIVHSDKIKITPEIMKAYGGKVPLKKGDLGRSVSDIVKKRDKRFEKRSGDEWNDNARKVSQLPFEEMSDELSQIYQSSNEMAVGGDIIDFISDPGNAPIIGSGINALTSAFQKPEKVSYKQATFSPTNFTPISTESGIGRIKRSFGNTRERLRRLNPRMYMNQLANLGAAEAETIGDYTGQIQGANAQGQNQASMMDSQNRSRLSMFNTQVGMQEAEANAANRAMKKTTTSANLNNLFTQVGQKARDTKLSEAQADYQDKMFELQKGYQDIWKDSSTKKDEEFEFGGNIVPKTTALLSKRRYKTY